MSARKIVVIDTNVIISGILQTGDSYPSKIIVAWLLGQFQPAISQELKNEINQTLKKPYLTRGLNDRKSIKPILGSLFNKALTVLPLAIDEIVFPDKEDHFLLELAVAAEAVAIVTGDKALLKVKSVENIKILAPQQFCQRFKIK